MVRRHEVRVRGNLQPGGIRPARFQAINLIKERLEVNHHAIAQHRGGVFRKNPGGQELQLVFFTADHDGVPGVIAAVRLDYVVNFPAEDIGSLALAFVAPLGADNDDRCHLLSHFLIIEAKIRIYLTLFWPQ